MAEKPGDGVFVLTETGITQLKFRQDGCDEIAVASFLLGPCASQELSCSLHASEGKIVASSRNEAVIFESGGIKRVRLPQTQGECSTRHHSTRRLNGRIIIDLLDLVYHDSSPEWHYTGVLIPSVQVYTKVFKCRPSDLVRGDHSSFLAILSRHEGKVLAMMPHTDVPVNTMSLRISQEQSAVFLSRNGYVVGEKNRSALTVWKFGQEYKRYTVDQQIASIRLADNGAIAALLFFQLDQSPSDLNVTGFVDLIGTRIIGQAKDHVHGFGSPCAFSDSGSFFASLIIDNTAIGHPSGLSSGTVVVSHL